MSKVTDPDLMMLADGELDAADASALERAAGANGSLKVAAVREVGDLVRGHLELAADEADERLNGLWDLVERRLDTHEDAVATKAEATPATPGLWARVVKWFDGHRAHLLTGALSAGAVAALAFVLREDPRVEYRDRIIEKPIATAPTDAGEAGANPVVLVATPPEVESLEVNGGTGTVFTIENDDGETETAVIWVTPDDVLEGI